MVCLLLSALMTIAHCDLDHDLSRFDKAGADFVGVIDVDWHAKRSGGVAQAVVNAIKKTDPDREVKVAKATGLEECRKMLMLAKAGKYDGYLLEGMACPGGCIAGAGTLQSIEKSMRSVSQFAMCAPHQCASDTPYMDYLHLVEERE